MSRKKWVISPCDKERAADIAENCGVDPFASFLICARGMTDEFEVESFLYDTDLIDPYTLPDMEKAVNRILKAVDNGEKITVFGDYDADGVTSTALMYSYLFSKGANVDYYIPDREAEGYGMNSFAVDTLEERGTSLIVTVDNGISAVDEIEYAKEKGIDVVVTDHHKAGDILPQAVAVVDPHREDSVCEFSDWAGVGVAFKVVCALEGSDGYELLEKYGDIVALGTVADIVPLKGENRIIVRSAMAYINASVSDGTLRQGLKALLAVSGAQGAVDASALAFKIGPRINAAGRMGSAQRALKLLLCENYGEAMALAEEISQDNVERQGIESQISSSAEEFIENNPSVKNRRVLVVEGEGWHQGVIGIVASRLTEKYGKPCIIISKNGDTAKGSGRSIEGFSLYEGLSYCADLLLQFGGHTLAAGLSLESEKTGEFREKINEYAEGLDTLTPVLHIDCKLNPVSVNLDLLSSLEILEPYGADNPQPLFGLYNMTVTALQSVGGGKHIRMTVERKGCSINAIVFSVSIEEFPYKIGDCVDLAVRLSLNEFQGKSQVSIQVKAIRFSGSDDEKLLKSLALYEDFCFKGKMSREAAEYLSVSREFCADVYKFVKRNNGWAYSAEILCSRLDCAPERVGACQIALDIFCQLGILEKKQNKYFLAEGNVKNPLENSEIFKKASQ